MATQLALDLTAVPVTCEVQQRYHAIAPVLAGQATTRQRAETLNLSYGTVHRWLREFRAQGMPGLFSATDYPREPHTPESVIVQLLYFKCCLPSASDRELARVVSHLAERRLHHETVKALLARYPFWRYPEFQRPMRYPVPRDPQQRRLEMVKLKAQGWTEKRIAQLLGCSRNTVMKWLRRARLAAPQPDGGRPGLWDLSSAPHHPRRRVHFGAIYAVLQLQKKYGYAGPFRIRGYLEEDFDIKLSEATVKKIMALNRRVHLAPRRPVLIEVREARQGPPRSEHAFQHTFIDLRYLDAKPEGVQLYSCLLLEGYSRTILAGALTPRQEVGVVLHVYFQALLRWGLWGEIVSDHGGQFISRDFARVNQRLRIHHELYEKGQPWRNLIESQFGIQARVGEYHWERCGSVAAAVEFHRQLIRDHNRLPHWAHRRRQDQKHAPLAVLGPATGKAITPREIQRAFGQRYCQRRTDAQGFVRIGGWRIYVEEGLPHTPVQLSYWDGKLRAEYQTQTLTEYDCRWGSSSPRPKKIGSATPHEHPFHSRQQTLFDPLWLRDPLESGSSGSRKQEKKASPGIQQRLYFGPELVRTGT
jgi:putative transposase